MRKKLILTSALKIKKTTLYRLEDTQLSIINMQSGQMYRLSGMGIYLWWQLDGSQNVEEILSKFKKETGMTTGKVIQQAQEFFEKLFEENLIELEKKALKATFSKQGVGEIFIKKLSRKIELPKKIALDELYAAGGTGGSGGCGGGSGACGAGGGTGSQGTASTASTASTSAGTSATAGTSS